MSIKKLSHVFSHWLLSCFTEKEAVSATEAYTYHLAGCLVGHQFYWLWIRRRLTSFIDAPSGTKTGEVVFNSLLHLWGCLYYLRILKNYHWGFSDHIMRRNNSRVYHLHHHASIHWCKLDNIPCMFQNHTWLYKIKTPCTISFLWVSNWKSVTTKFYGSSDQ